MLVLLARLWRLLWRYRAKRWGISYERASKFKIPGKILVRQKRVKIVVPLEGGVNCAFMDIFLDDCYGLRKLKQPITSILDIGAHCGLFGLAARNAFPKAIIHSYEPSLHLEKYLKEQSRAGDFSYYMEAVGLKDGVVTLDYHEDSVQTKVASEDNGDIPMISLNKAIQRLGGQVDLVKLDCEGSEWNMFKDKKSWEAVQNISMEYHLWPDHSHDEIRNVLQQLGFRIKTHTIVSEKTGLITGAKR